LELKNFYYSFNYYFSRNDKDISENLSISILLCLYKGFVVRNVYAAETMKEINSFIYVPNKLLFKGAAYFLFFRISRREGREGEISLGK